MRSYINNFIALFLLTIGLVTQSVYAQGISARRISAQSILDSIVPVHSRRTVSFTTTELTWSNVDVSPDGKTIVFDLLGDLYTLPITGGHAKRLTHGLAMDQKPRFSPDGRQIAFLSDRNGVTNLWVMRQDGTGMRRLGQLDGLVQYFDNHDMLGTPRWSPDSRTILISDNTRNQLLRYDVQSGAVHVIPDVISRDLLGGFTLDGQHVVYADDRVYPQVSLLRLDLRDSHRTSLARFKEGMYNLNVTPNGQAIVYLTRASTSPDTRESSRMLRVLSLDTGSDTLGTEIARFPGSIEEHRPGFAVTPDSRAVILNEGGELKRVDLITREVTTIPCTVNVEVQLAPLNIREWRLPEGQVPIKQLRSVKSSVDGRQIVFDALGSVWRATSGQPAEQLSGDTKGAFDPALSPDGRWVAWVSWSESTGGAVWKQPVQGGTAALLARDNTQMFSEPVWAPDGTALVVAARPAEQVRAGTDYLQKGTTTFIKVSAAVGGEVQRIPGARSSYDSRLTDWRTAPVLSRDSTELFWSDNAIGGVTLQVLALRRDTVPRPVLRVTGEDEMVAVPSPDSRWIAVQSDFNIYVMPFPTSLPKGSRGDSVQLISLKGRELPKGVRQITVTGGIAPNWSANGQWLEWSWINQSCRLPIAAVIAAVGTTKLTNTLTAKRPVAPACTSVSLTVPRPQATGSVLLRGARVITMAARGMVKTPAGDGGVQVTTDPGVIEQGDVLITGRRITAVGASGSLAVPAGTKVLEMGGRTIIPGLMDLHADFYGGHWQGVPAQPWIEAAMLAYGVTTVRKPGGTELGDYELSERLTAGEFVGSRFFTSGFLTNKRISTRATAEHVAAKYAALGALFLKERGSLTYGRLGRIEINQAAARHGLMVTSHWKDYHVFDGYAGWEHTGPRDQQKTAIYRDWIELFGRSGTTNTPTMRGNFETCINWGNAKIRRWFAPSWLATKKDSATVCKPEALQPPQPAADQLRGMRDVVRAGGNVTSGGHGGESMGILSSHYAMWYMVMAGWTPAEALRAGTLNSARGLGLEADLGSIEPGKIADLVVLNRNPLEDIHVTTDVAYVVQDGIIRDANTLDELWPRQVPFVPLPWNR